MRELKFRVWHKNKYIELTNLRGEKSIYFSPYDLGVITQYIDRKEVVLEQYTGLKDKNGKEIYEGDILSHRGRFYEVKFDNYGQFYIENKNYHWLENGYSFRSVDIWCAEGILVEIIGNIHENPELLEEE